MSNPVSYRLQGKVGVITVNNPPVNALSYRVRGGIKALVEQAQADNSEILLIVCEGKTFIAGADISEFGKPPQPPSLPDTIAAIEDSAKPVVAALHGTALGGGLEVALGAHYRCAVPSAKVGLPEVKLGLLPGAGGTQRLPRLIGVEAALGMITKGNPVAAEQARAWGLVDEIIEGDLLEGALAYANKLADSGAPVRKTREAAIDSAPDADFFTDYFGKLPRALKRQTSVGYIVELVKLATQSAFAEGVKQERAYFVECRDSQQSAAMRHFFFAQRKSTQVPDIPKDTPTLDVQSVAVIGAGTMGGGIAMSFANAGIPVVLVDAAQEGLDRGLATITRNYGNTVKRGRLSQQQMDERIGLISGTLDYGELARVDLVIEAVFEDMAVKRELLAKLDAVCKADCIIASNTSYLDINELAQASNRQAYFLGMHFFSPANVMKLLEVVRSKTVSREVIATVMKLAKRIQKTAILVGVCNGFVGNRMYREYKRESNLLLLEGASPEQVDRVMENWGMAMGPLAVGDMSGLDIGYYSRRNDGIESGAEKDSAVPDALVDMGRLGQKSGSGYYDYDSETRKRTPSGTVQNLIAELAAKWQTTPREIGDEEIVQRMVYSLMNEGAKILEEGIATRPSDIDLAFINGYGFPALRGGPMHYADAVGLQKVVDEIARLREVTGDDYWTPSALLQRLADEGKGFNSLN